MGKNPLLKHDDLLRARRILRGDRDAFEDFFERYFDPVYRFALSRVGDESLAKDLVQSTFCIAIEKLDTYRGEAALLSWMCSICRYEILALAKRDRRETRLEPMADSPEIRAVLEVLATGEASAEDETLRSEMIRLVHLTLDHLPQHYGQALEWKYFEGLSVVEIGARLNLGTKAAESMLTRARDAFRSAFKTIGREMTSPARPHRLVSAGNKP